MIKTFSVLIFSGLFLSTFGQIASAGKIKATIRNDQHLPVENVTVQLMNMADSSLLKVAITDKEGVADFEHIHFGNFFLKIQLF